MVQNLSKSGNEIQIALWVERAQAGDVTSFENLYREFHQRLYLFASRMTGCVSLAEEVVQEVFIKAWRKLDYFRHDSQFYTWLRKIASHTVIDKLRAKNSAIYSNTIEIDELQLQGRERVGESDDLEKLISRLPSGARSVFILHDIEGYSHREISELIQVAEGTSKAQLHRARKLLREQLEVGK